MKQQFFLTDDEKALIIEYRKQNPVIQSMAFRLLRIDIPETLVKRLNDMGYDEHGNVRTQTAKIVTGVFD